MNQNSFSILTRYDSSPCNLSHFLWTIRKRVDNLGDEFADKNFTFDDFSGDCIISYADNCKIMTDGGKIFQVCGIC